MTLKLAAGLGLALLSAGALNWGFFVQHTASSELPLLTISRPWRSLRLLFHHPRWLTGFLVGVGGWALYVVALALAPLSLVQAVSAGGIGLLALLVSRANETRLGGRERLGVTTAVVGLGLLALSLGSGSAHGSVGSPGLVIAWLLGSAAVAAALAGPGAPFLAGGAGLGLAAGTLYAAGDVATKAALPGGGRLVLVAAVLASHGLAFVAFQLSLQRGTALASAGLSTLCTNALPIAAGMTVFREGVPAGAFGTARLVAFASVVVGATLLAQRSEPGSVSATAPKATRSAPA